MEFLYGKGLHIIFLICFTITLFKIIGAIAFFIFVTEKFRQPSNINNSNEPRRNILPKM